jgi:hypothetical protein
MTIAGTISSCPDVVELIKCNSKISPRLQSRAEKDSDWRFKKTHPSKISRLSEENKELGKVIHALCCIYCSEQSNITDAGGRGVFSISGCLTAVCSAKCQRLCVGEVMGLGVANP